MRIGVMRWVNFSKTTWALVGRPCTVICGLNTTVMSRGLTIITPLSGSVLFDWLGSVGTTLRTTMSKNW